MKAIGRRLNKLEVTLLPQPETRQMQQLKVRIEAGRKRVAAVYGERAPLPIAIPRPLDHRDVTIFDRLHAGRMRVHQEWLTRGGKH